MQISNENKKIATYSGIAVAGFIFYNIITGKRGANNNSNGIDPTGNGNTFYVTPKFDAKKTAEDLYDAMKEMGSSNDEIIEILKPISASQIILVANAFGKRSYNSNLGNQYRFNPFVKLPLELLKIWLREELPEKMFLTLKKRYSNYL